VSGAWGDYDNDGRIDLFVANSAWNPGGHRNTLYRNLGGDEFVRVTNALTASVNTSWSGQWGDYDNDGDVDADGDLDLYVSRYQGTTNFLYRNDAGRLEQVTAGSLPARRSTWAAVWADFNNDGPR